MKAIKTTIAILASSLAIGAIAQSADSASVGASDVANLTGQANPPVWTELGLNGTQSSQVTGAINANNALINQELAKRDVEIAALKELIKKSAGSGTSASSCTTDPYGYSSGAYEDPPIKPAGGWANGTVLLTYSNSTSRNYTYNKNLCVSGTWSVIGQITY